MTLPRACAIDNFLNLGSTCSCVEVPFQGWPNLAFGLDGHQDCTPCARGCLSHVPPPSGEGSAYLHIPVACWVLPRRTRNRAKTLRESLKSLTICAFKKTHGRIEHLMNINVVLDRATWMKFGTFTPGNLNAGGFVTLARNGVLRSDCTAEHEENVPGHDHLIRIPAA